MRWISFGWARRTEEREEADKNVCPTEEREEADKNVCPTEDKRLKTGRQECLPHGGGFWRTVALDVNP
jgi:hypothetical protein